MTTTSTTPTLQFRRCSFEGRTFQHSFKGNGKITDKSSNEAIGKQSLESPGSNLTNPSKLVNVKKSSPDQTLKLSQMSLMRRCGRLISSEFTFASIDGAHSYNFHLMKKHSWFYFLLLQAWKEIKTICMLSGLNPGPSAFQANTFSVTQSICQIAKVGQRPCPEIMSIGKPLSTCLLKLVSEACIFSKRVIGFLIPNPISR